MRVLCKKIFINVNDWFIKSRILCNYDDLYYIYIFIDTTFDIFTNANFKNLWKFKQFINFTFTFHK